MRSASGRLAPEVGLEPTAYRLTAGCSAIELLRNIIASSATNVSISNACGFVKKNLVSTLFCLNAPFCLFQSRRKQMEKLKMTAKFARLPNLTIPYVIMYSKA